MHTKDTMTVQEAVDLACDNPRDLPNCLGWATTKTDAGSFCEFCRTFEILTTAGLEPEVVKMTTVEKIKAIMAANLPFAFDTCHKIYFLEDDARRQEAESYGYSILPASSLPDAILDSCPLLFVSRWGFDNSDFAHDWNIVQGTEDIYKAARRIKEGRA